MGLYGDQFKEKVAIVTGAGGGIGQAYAEALAREGAAVVVADINTEGAQKVADGIKGEGGNGARACAVDVSDPDSAKEMAAQTLSEFGGIDYLVNNAAIFGGMKLDFLHHRRLGLLQEVHEREHGRRAGVHPRGLPQDGQARRRRDRQPVVDRGVAVLELLRPGQGRHQRPDPAAGHRTRRPEHPGQRHRARPHRHRGQPDHHAARRWSPTS